MSGWRANMRRFSEAERRRMGRRFYLFFGCVFLALLVSKVTGKNPDWSWLLWLLGGTAVVSLISGMLVQPKDNAKIESEKDSDRIK
jgi:phosphatidylglycerophosphate synthase